ncbi:MAG: isocitrate/isopropylmalate dehydrogenase family protein [Deltaproteobacteria bacterium]|nr:isocitrate/isopropylmalate dehydrogenase family protein [Deltaproteobacteria bacterium]
MAKYRIAILPGDGIGKEVTEAAMMVLEKIGLNAEYLYGDIGWEFWKKEGDALPERTIDLLCSTDVCLFGAITSKTTDEASQELGPSLSEKGLKYNSPIIRLRQLFDLYINLRPCKAFSGNLLNYREGIDLVIFRENTEGLYSGVEFHPVPLEVRRILEEYNSNMKRFSFAGNEETAISLRLVTKKGCHRIVKKAFEYAKQFGRKRVTLVEKANVLRETGGLMVREAREVAQAYPDIIFDVANVDAMTMWLIKNPEQYDILVAENLFGDIISDLGAQLVGGLGFSASGNIGDRYAIFEPTHGSAPKYAGLGKANPLAMLNATVMMLEWIGALDCARALERAVRQVIIQGEVRTYDMGGKASTTEMAQAVVKEI